MSGMITERCFVTVKDGIGEKEVADCVKEYCQIAKGTPGYQGGIWGIQMENPNVMETMTFWDNIQEYKDFVSDTAKTEKRHNLIKSVKADKPVEMFHVKFSPAPPSTVGSPTIELLTLYPLPEDFTEDALSPLVDLQMGVKECTALSRGFVIPETAHTTEEEMKKSYVLAFSWDSLEAHEEALRTTDRSAARPKVKVKVEKHHVIFKDFKMFE